MATKTSDLSTVPLCTYHHNEWHKTGRIEPFDAAETELLFAQAMARTLQTALLLGLKL